MDVLESVSLRLWLSSFRSPHLIENVWSISRNRPVSAQSSVVMDYTELHVAYISIVTNDTALTGCRK